MSEQIFYLSKQLLFESEFRCVITYGKKEKRWLSIKYMGGGNLNRLRFDGSVKEVELGTDMLSLKERPVKEVEVLVTKLAHLHWTNSKSSLWLV